MHTHPWPSHFRNNTNEPEYNLMEQAVMAAESILRQAVHTPALQMMLNIVSGPCGCEEHPLLSVVLLFCKALFSRNWSFLLDRGC